VAAEKLKLELKEELQQVFCEIGGAVTVDFWTDDYKKCSYLAVTAHYITKDWTLKSALLDIIEWNDTLRRTGDNVRPVILKCLQEFGVDEITVKSKVVFVTDQGSNLIKALRSFTRLNCSCHVLNLIMSNVFKGADDNTDIGGGDDEFGEIIQCVKYCKELVTYLIQTNLKHRLAKSIRQDVATRWHSKIDMMESVIAAFPEIENLLDEKNECDRLYVIDKHLLERILETLRPFK